MRTTITGRGTQTPVLTFHGSLWQTVNLDLGRQAYSRDTGVQHCAHCATLHAWMLGTALINLKNSYDLGPDNLCANPWAEAWTDNVVANCRAALIYKWWSEE